MDKIWILAQAVDASEFLKVTYQAKQVVQSLHIHEVSPSMPLRSMDVMLRESTRISFLFQNNGCSVYSRWSVNLIISNHSHIDPYRNVLCEEYSP